MTQGFTTHYGASPMKERERRGSIDACPNQVTMNKKTANSASRQRNFSVQKRYFVRETKSIDQNLPKRVPITSLTRLYVNPFIKDYHGERQGCGVGRMFYDSDSTNLQ